MKDPGTIDMEARFLHFVFSPKGEIEGLMAKADERPIQFVLDPRDEAAVGHALQLKPGHLVALRARAAAPSPKGVGEHPVFDLVELLGIDGQKPARAPEPSEPTYRGRVERFNYARHGEINGVVLDNGDFLHFKPDGYAQLRLQLGDEVAADGEARRLADDSGWAVEATTVNGRAIRKP